MTPEEQLRALRSDDRWEQIRLAARPSGLASRSGLRDRRSAIPLIITAVVAALVVILSVGAIRLANRTGPAPAATPSVSISGATAIIHGTAPTTTRLLAGAGRPGGPSAAEIARLQTVAKRVGKMVGQPSTAASNDERLGAAVRSVHSAFGSAVHEAGGSGPGISVFFLVLNRTPSTQELELLHLLPFTVRVTWGPHLSTEERDRLQQAAFASLGHLDDAEGDTDAETETQELSFWPDRDHPQTAAQIARRMAATIERISGAPPTFSIRVTDESKTPAGQAAIHATSTPLADDGTRLLIAVRPTDSSFAVGVGVGSRDGYDLNPQRCVALGTAVIIAPPGSSISPDGRSIHAEGLGTYPVDTGSTDDVDGITSGGGAFIDAKTAASYLPRGSTLCGASRFLLIGR